LIYVFECVSPDHENAESRVFDQIVHGIPVGKIVSQYACPECGGISKRRIDKELPTQSIVGLKPVSHSSTGKGSLFNETSMAFGRFEKNADGSDNMSKPRFRDSGELQKFMDGKNELGDPIVKDNGEPLKRPDGTMVRRGAKLFKYGNNASPSKDGVRKAPTNRRGAKWVGDQGAKAYGATDARSIMKRAGY
jgi:hypothetical protein